MQVTKLVVLIYPLSQNDRNINWIVSFKSVSPTECRQKREGKGSIEVVMCLHFRHAVQNVIFLRYLKCTQVGVEKELLGDGADMDVQLHDQNY